MKQKIIVFGGLGFIGGHVVENLVEKGFDVVVFDRFKNHAEYRHIDAPYSYFQGDVTDAEAVAEVMFGADGFINLAGILGTSETVDNPMPSIMSNVVGGMNVLMAAKQHKVKGVQIAVGNHFMNNSYSITKTTQERFTLMFNKEHGTKIAVVRALNAYGERQKHKPVRKIIPNFVTKALRGEPILIYGSGNQIMDMIYVKDLAEILVRALIVEHGVYDSIFEAGSGVRTTVNDIAIAVKKASNSSSMLVYKAMRAGEVEDSVVMGDPTTLKPLFDGQVPTLSKLEDKLPEVVSWYVANYPYKED